MPTKHIDATQWATIEAMTLELARQKNATIKEGDVLKEVIAAGLEVLNFKGLSDRFEFQARYNAIIMCKLHHGGTASTSITVPSVATTAALLDGNEGFIVCVYGNTNTGRSTFAQALYDELNGADGRTVNLYDDADHDAIRHGWADYKGGKGAIVVLQAGSQIKAMDGLYSTHRAMLILEEGREIPLESSEPVALDTSLLRATNRSEP